jgi:hypothetical protein
MCSSGTCSDCEQERKNKEAAYRFISGYAGFWSGMATGAAAGSVVPVIGTVPGAVAGAIIGTICGAGRKKK